MSELSHAPLPAAAHHHHGPCPACGGALSRVHRHRLDRWFSSLRSVHRYRCGHCHWEGLLGRAGTAPTAPAPVTWRARLVWMLVGAACALAAAQGARLAWRAQAARHQPPAVASGAGATAQQTPAGQDFAGEALPAQDLRVTKNPSPLTLRRSCAWGVPGANPYRGTVAQALQAAQLPAEVVREISEKAEHGWTRGQVEITRSGIRTLDRRRDFGTHIKAMAFGNTLCFDTRVNFPAGHVEYASLYEAADKVGRTYTVMVPFVCGNASVLGQRGEIEFNDLPEPATWALVALLLPLLAGATQWARTKRGA